jgi:chloramphenicol 3-O phosphotransferase
MGLQAPACAALFLACALDTLRRVAPRVVVLNGGSSSGKTSIVRQMQAMLVEPWLAMSIDDFVNSLPPALQDSSDGFDVTTDGTVQIGATFTRLEAAWMAGVAATARAGAPVIVDDVFLSTAASQARWRTALAELAVAWVGVHCDPDVATQREARRSDRDAGMAALQARAVHHDVVYDVEVDTSRTSSQDCARSIVTGLHLPCSTAVCSLDHQAAP